MKCRLFISIFCLFLIISCKTNVDENDDISIHANILTNSNGVTVIKVYPVDCHGQIVGGVSVLAKNVENVVSILDFDNQNQVFYTNVDALDTDNFTIIVKNLYNNQKYTMNVPHKKITTAPSVETFMDETGNNVLNGNSLKKNKKINIAWDSTGDDIVYQVIIKTATSIKWMTTTSNCFVQIPELTFLQGSYYLCIKAQKSFGDIFYETENYYSLAEKTSSSLMFYVE